MFDYQFKLENGETVSFQIDPERTFSPEVDAAPHAEWTKLETEQCPNCTLSGRCKHCPAAVDIEDIAHRFAPVLSCSTVTVRVKAKERLYGMQCDAQTAVNSLLGLVLATSACPILSRFKPLARFHLPFSSPEETIFRTVGSYLIQQYLLAAEGGKPDWDLKGLDKLYEDLDSVNRSLVERLRKISEQEANVNAVVMFCGLSLLVRFSLHDQLVRYRDLLR